MTTEQRRLYRIGVWLEALTKQGDESSRSTLDKIDLLQASVDSWTFKHDFDLEE